MSFWDRVTKTDSCWTWNGSKTSGGYGSVTYEGKFTVCHRVSWELTNGPIPNGLRVLHKCDNPPCVNPDHLFLGTQADNMRDAYRKGRVMIRRGSDTIWSKLTEEDIPAIRCMYGEGFTQAAIARQFGVATDTIWDVTHGRTWRHA